MKIAALTSILALLAACDGVSAKNDKKKKGELAEASFVLVGDSTTNNNTVTPNCESRLRFQAGSHSSRYSTAGGWGNGFCASLQPGIGCGKYAGSLMTCPSILTHCGDPANYGSNGATTGTIVDRGLYGQALDRTKAEIASGKEVFVTLQFGHSTSSVEAQGHGTNYTDLSGPSR